MADSTIPAAKAKILELLAARAALEGVGIDWVEPAKEADVKRDMIWLGDVEQTENWATLGADRRDESYLLEVHCQAYRQGDKPTDTELVCFALRDEIAVMLRDHKELDGVLLSPGVASLERTRLDSPQLADQGWLSHCLLHVRCTARI